MWVKCTRVGVFSIQEKIGEAPQVSFPRGFVYSSQIKGFFFFFFITRKGLFCLVFSSDVLRMGTFSVVRKSDDSSQASLTLESWESYPVGGSDFLCSFPLFHPKLSSTCQHGYGGREISGQAGREALSSKVNVLASAFAAEQKPCSVLDLLWLKQQAPSVRLLHAVMSSAPAVFPSCGSRSVTLSNFCFRTKRTARPAIPTLCPTP